MTPSFKIELDHFNADQLHAIQIALIELRFVMSITYEKNPLIVIDNFEKEIKNDNNRRP